MENTKGERISDRRLFNCLLIFSLILAGCGGGGGGDESSSNNGGGIPDDSETQTESLTWQDGGSFRDDLIVRLESNESDQDVIYRLDIEGDSHTKLSRDMQPGGKIARMRVSPDGRKLGYLADQDRANKYELYLANADGSQNLRVLKVETGEIYNFLWSPDSNYVQYEWQDDTYIFDLRTLESTKEPEALARQWSSDSRRLARLIKNAEQSFVIQIADVENDFALVSEVSLEGYELDEDISWNGDRIWNENLTKMLFQTDEDFWTKTSSIHWVDTSTGQVTDVIHGKNLNIPTWSPNGADIAYWGREPTTEIIELFVFNTLNNVTTQITYTLKRTDYTMGYVFWVDGGNEMYFMGNSPIDNKKELFRADVPGFTAEGLFALGGIDQAVVHFTIASNARDVALSTDSGSHYIYNAETHLLTDVSSNLVTTGSVRNYAWTPSAEHLVYLPRQKNSWVVIGTGNTPSA